MAILQVSSFKRRHGALKANMNIAFEYAKLCEEEEVRDIFNIILDEWQLTKDVILQIEGHDELLAENPYLKIV